MQHSICFLQWGGKMYLKGLCSATGVLLYLKEPQTSMKLGLEKKSCVGICVVYIFYVVVSCSYCKFTRLCQEALWEPFKKKGVFAYLCNAVLDLFLISSGQIRNLSSVPGFSFLSSGLAKNRVIPSSPSYSQQCEYKHILHRSELYWALFILYTLDIQYRQNVQLNSYSLHGSWGELTSQSRI